MQLPLLWRPKVRFVLVLPLRCFVYCSKLVRGIVPMPLPLLLLSLALSFKAADQRLRSCLSQYIASNQCRNPIDHIIHLAINTLLTNNVVKFLPTVGVFNMYGVDRSCIVLDMDSAASCGSACSKAVPTRWAVKLILPIVTDDVAVSSLGVDAMTWIRLAQGTPLPFGQVYDTGRMMSI
jgi:hypothetical protein